MKKNIITALLFALFLSCGPICNHVHTEECGENGENCTHECMTKIAPFKSEKPSH